MLLMLCHQSIPKSAIHKQRQCSQRQFTMLPKGLYFSKKLVSVVVVDYGLTSHSAIFQLYRDGTDVQFPNFDLLPGTHAMGS